MVGVTLAVALGRGTLVRRVSASTGRVTRAARVVLVVAGVVQAYVHLFGFGGLAAPGL